MKTSQLPEARENGSETLRQVLVESDWLRKWRKFSELITERSKAKSKQSRIISTRIENCCIT